MKGKRGQQMAAASAAAAMASRGILSLLQTNSEAARAPREAQEEAGTRSATERPRMRGE